MASTKGVEEMKYEDWIKYEQLRQRQTDPKDWVMLPPGPVHPDPHITPPSPEDKNRVWTMVVQIFNLRRI